MVRLAYVLLKLLSYFGLVLYEKAKYTHFNAFIVVKYFIQKQGCDLFNYPVL